MVDIKLLEQKKQEALSLSMTLHSQACDKEAKMESFVQKWLNDESEINNESMQQLLDSVTEQVAELKRQAEAAWKEYQELLTYNIIVISFVAKIQHLMTFEEEDRTGSKRIKKRLFFVIRSFRYVIFFNRHGCLPRRVSRKFESETLIYIPYIA